MVLFPLSEKQRWMAAAEEEIRMLNQQKVWKLVEFSSGKELVK